MCTWPVQNHTWVLFELFGVLCLLGLCFGKHTPQFQQIFQIGQPPIAICQACPSSYSHWGAERGRPLHYCLGWMWTICCNLKHFEKQYSPHNQWRSFRFQGKGSWDRLWRILSLEWEYMELKWGRSSGLDWGCSRRLFRRSLYSIGVASFQN